MQTLWNTVADLFATLRARAAAQANLQRRDYTFLVGQDVLISQQRHRFIKSAWPYTAMSPRVVGPYSIVQQLTKIRSSWTFPLQC